MSCNCGPQPGVRSLRSLHPAAPRYTCRGVQFTRGWYAMHDIMRDRIWRKLQVLPENQLYQVLDYIEFLESKYAPGRAAKPDTLQRFAERLEDGMRIRSVAPKVISGTVGLMGTARSIIRTVGEELTREGFQRELNTHLPSFAEGVRAVAGVARL